MATVPGIASASIRRNALQSNPSPSQDSSSATATSSVRPCAGTLREDEKEKYQGWRRIVRNFTPSWFSVTMGTGIVSILLHDIPYQADWLYWLSIIIFALNATLFVLFTAVSLVRYTLYPEIWGVMIRHPAQSLFLGTFPMGLATLINMIVLVCVPAWGDWAVTLAWALWWIDAVISLATCLYLPFMVMSVHKHSHLGTMTAAWLLPIVTTIVAAASGGLVAEVLPNKQHALWTVLISYVLWGTGVPFAMVVLVIYFQRLTIFQLPAKEVIVSVFLPLGPLGQGGFAMMQLGKVALTLFPDTNTLTATAMAGPIMYVIGFLMGLIMWGFGLVWLFFAVATLCTQQRFPFNMGWWGFTFPLGVFTVSTLTMGNELPSRFFDVLGTGLAVCVVVLWLIVASGTLKRALVGEIFVAPCLGDLPKKQSQQAATEGA